MYNNNQKKEIEKKVSMSLFIRAERLTIYLFECPILDINRYLMIFVCAVSQSVWKSKKYERKKGRSDELFDSLCVIYSPLWDYYMNFNFEYFSVYILSNISVVIIYT